MDLTNDSYVISIAGTAWTESYYRDADGWVKESVRDEADLATEHGLGLQGAGQVAVDDAHQQADVLDGQGQVEPEAVQPLLVLERGLVALPGDRVAGK